MKRIVCADGTWNDPERRNEKTGRIYLTNVLKVVRAVRPQSAQGVAQVVYYHEGVGTAGLGKDSSVEAACSASRGYGSEIPCLARFWRT